MILLKELAEPSEFLPMLESYSSKFLSHCWLLIDVDLVLVLYKTRLYALIYRIYDTLVRFFALCTVISFVVLPYKTSYLMSSQFDVRT
uniref:Uncharacterized protein n=1 Tax=Physcomitrium patens TaxID=3218 RepID=A0A2K1KFS0_PHYPA|nr:hypothetical protein PHYPA_008996 [Physcomitrium patens]